MDYLVKPMTEVNARKICLWKYDEPYSIYNLSFDSECILELLNGSYYSVEDNCEELVGFFCYGESAQVPCSCSWVYEDKSAIDIGLGMKPELTGNGKGVEFVKAGLKFGEVEYSTDKFRLTVATFNKRAIRVYEGLGFKGYGSFIIRRASGDIEFIVMKNYNFKL